MSKLSSAPGGLRIPIKATLSGRLRWQVLDERLMPEIARTPSGVAIAPPEGVKQNNLITNRGLDLIGTTGISYPVSGSANADLRAYLAVGTGSAAPLVTDTQLSSEVQRNNSAPSFSMGSLEEYGLDDTLDVWRYTYRATRTVTMTADRNLTEFGFSPNTTLTDIAIRELFRDEFGDPVTISLLNGKSVKVDHYLTIEIPAPELGFTTTINIDYYDATNQFVSSSPYNVTYGATVNTPGQGIQAVADMYPLMVWQQARGAMWIPVYNGIQSTLGVRAIISPLTYARINSHVNTAFSPTILTGNNSSSAFVALGLETYVGGTYQRIARATVATGSGNTSWYGYLLGGSPSRQQKEATSGMTLHFDSPTTYTKASTDTLRVGLVSSWARASEGSS